MALSEENLAKFLDAMSKFYGQGDDSQIPIIFNLIDFNHDGKIQREELGAVLEQLNHTALTRDEIDRRVAAADTSGDGVISISEFLEMMKIDRSEVVP